MERTIALIFQKLLGFRKNETLTLPPGPKQALTADISCLSNQTLNGLSFHTPVGSGLSSVLKDLYLLYGAIRYFYCGEKTRLFSDGLDPSNYSWLEILPLGDRTPVISINRDGTLAHFLPPPSPHKNARFRQKEYFVTPELVSWLAYRIWGFSQLRQGQFQIIQRLCRGENTLAILPTGGGKSLCFQLPALLLPGTTLVVSPLKSLMRDQHFSLKKAGIQGTAFIDSSKSSAEKAAIIGKLKAGSLKLLYLSPERLQIESFQKELAIAMDEHPISLFAIDEAHCISEWGHDFRPSYLRLRQYVEQLHSPPICALTATASRYVRQDILNLLGLNNQDIITPETLDRKEISLQVCLLGEDDDTHQELINTVTTGIPKVLDKSLAEIHKWGAGLIFTPYAAPRGRHTAPLGSEAVANLLLLKGFKCQHYHAQLPDAQRISVQDRFKENTFPILVATKGYGMGIDKENIDYVVHLSAPASLEAYYQEAGRAGRDGEHAHSVIIARPRKDKCLQNTAGRLPECCRGWHCDYSGGEKCSFGIQAALLALEYPAEKEVLRHFTNFLSRLETESEGRNVFVFTSPSLQTARQQKYLYYLEQLGAVQEYWVLEYRKVADNQYDVLIKVRLTAPNSLENKYWLANKVVQKLSTYKAQKLNMLNTVEMYIKATTCRRRFLMQYFGDSCSYEQCNFCDSDGISKESLPIKAETSAINSLNLLEQALITGNVGLALALAKTPASEELGDQITIRAMRELEDRPHNPAALFLAGLFTCRDPETRPYGLRNLQGAVHIALSESPPLVGKIIGHLPSQLAYELAKKYIHRLSDDSLRELAVTLDPPEQYPDVHLAYFLPLLKNINYTLREVKNNDSKGKGTI